MGEGKQTVWFPTLAANWRFPSTILSNTSPFHIYPHYGLMDLLNVKEKHDKDCIYLAGVGDGGSAEYADGLFRYNLVDETVLFLLPLSYGGGIPLTGEFRSARWKLLGCKTFSNGICRLMYKRNG